MYRICGLEQKNPQQMYSSWIQYFCIATHPLHPKHFLPPLTLREWNKKHEPSKIITYDLSMPPKSNIKKTTIKKTAYVTKHEKEK